MATARALMIFQENLHDAATFAIYREKVMPTLNSYQGKFLARGGKLSVLEGSWPYARTVVIEFPSRAQAEAWYQSPAYREILPLRLRSMECNAVIVDIVD